MADVKGIKTIFCDHCNYCIDHCTMGLDIPALIEDYNLYLKGDKASVIAHNKALDKDKRAGACTGCYNCRHSCVLRIDVPGIMEELASIVKAEGN